MAAILEPRHQLHLEAERPALRLVGTDGRAHDVPLDLGLTARHLVAALVAVLAVMAGTFAITSGALAGLAPGPATPAGAASPGQPSIEVEAGDSLWTIARRLQPSGDVRPLVDDLLELNGAGPLQPGDRILVPA